MLHPGANTSKPPLSASLWHRSLTDVLTCFAERLVSTAKSGLVAPVCSKACAPPTHSHVEALIGSSAG